MVYQYLEMLAASQSVGADLLSSRTFKEVVVVERRIQIPCNSVWQFPSSPLALLVQKRSTTTLLYAQNIDTNKIGDDVRGSCIYFDISVATVVERS